MYCSYGDKGWDLGDITSKAEQCIREHRGPASGMKEGEGCRLTGHMLVNKVRVKGGGRWSALPDCLFTCPAAEGRWELSYRHGGDAHAVSVRVLTGRIVSPSLSTLCLLLRSVLCRGSGHIHQVPRVTEKIMMLCVACSITRYFELIHLERFTPAPDSSTPFRCRSST
jgi:hypothetical protein